MGAHGWGTGDGIGCPDGRRDRGGQVIRRNGSVLECSLKYKKIPVVFKDNGEVEHSPLGALKNADR